MYTFYDRDAALYFKMKDFYVRRTIQIKFPQSFTAMVQDDFDFDVLVTDGFHVCRWYSEV